VALHGRQPAQNTSVKILSLLVFLYRSYHWGHASTWRRGRRWCLQDGGGWLEQDQTAATTKFNSLIYHCHGYSGFAGTCMYTSISAEKSIFSKAGNCQFQIIYVAKRLTLFCSCTVQCTSPTVTGDHSPAIHRLAWSWHSRRPTTFPKSVELQHIFCGSLSNVKLVGNISQT